MSNVIQLSEYQREPWEEVFSFDGPNSTLQVYANQKTGEIEVVQMNDDNEAIRTVISGLNVDHLILGLMQAFGKKEASK
jgi:hypothetical protein